MCPIYKVSLNLATNPFCSAEAQRDGEPERSLPHSACSGRIKRRSEADASGQLEGKRDGTRGCASGCIRGSSASGVETLRVQNPYLEDRKTLEKQAQWCERSVLAAQN
jgi:hypothetical protein